METHARNSLVEAGGSANFWVSPAGEARRVSSHADGAAQILGYPKIPSDRYFSVAGEYYAHMFDKGWLRVAIQHDSHMIKVDYERRMTRPQWDWVQDKAYADKLMVVDDRGHLLANFSESKEPEKFDPKKFVMQSPRTNMMKLPVGTVFSRGTFDYRDIGQTLVDYLKSVADHYADGFQESLDDPDVVPEEVVAQMEDYITGRYTLPYTFVGSSYGNASEIGVWPWDHYALEEAEDRGLLWLVVSESVPWHAVPPGTEHVLLTRPAGNNGNGIDELWDVATKTLVWKY